MNLKRKILIVDDEKDIIEAIKAELQEQGYEVSSARDGREALEKARREDPDLILLDLMLPKMDGYQVTALLKGDARYSHIPILLLTGRPPDADGGLSLEAGVNAYFTKPFRMEELFRKIQDLLCSRPLPSQKR